MSDFLFARSQLARRGALYLSEGLTSWWAPWLLALTSACALLVLWALRNTTSTSIAYLGRSATV